ncbi:MAG: hypothetical protein ACLP2Y_02995 [Limisphaerales bacterium]
MSATRQRIWLCWSPGQNCFHIESEDEGVRTNYQAFKRNAGVDYVPIGVFTSHEHASNAARELWPVLTKRENLFGHPAINAEN